MTVCLPLRIGDTSPKGQPKSEQLISARQRSNPGRYGHMVQTLIVPGQVNSFFSKNWKCERVQGLPPAVGVTEEI
jgi:hypothetical protein